MIAAASHSLCPQGNYVAGMDAVWLVIVVSAETTGIIVAINSVI